MKKIIFLIILFAPVFGFSQMLNDSTYKATNGKVYISGQDVKLGLGSAEDGSFKYIQPVGVKDGKASSDFAAQTVKMWRVRKIKRKEIDVVYGMFTSNKIVYTVKLEAAILAKELQ